MSFEEKLLIKKAQSGDVSAFERLIYKYDKQVLAIAYSYRNSKEDAKDIYQEVFMRVFKSLNSFEGKSEFSTWLYRITANVCITFKNQKKIYQYQSFDQEIGGEEDLTLEDILANDDETDSQTLGNELSKQICEALNELPEKQKMVFVLKNYNDKKIKEIAGIMNCNEGTVKKYLFTAVRKLREKLQEFSK